MESPTVLNEGISTLFSVLSIAKLCDVKEVISDLEKNNKKYHDALVLVNELMLVDAESIKKLRIIEPLVNRLELAHFAAVGVDVPEHLKAQLLCQFE